jgi:hypothetical protein
MSEVVYSSDEISPELLFEYRDAAGNVLAWADLEGRLACAKGFEPTRGFAMMLCSELARFYAAHRAVLSRLKELERELAEVAPGVEKRIADLIAERDALLARVGAGDRLTAIPAPDEAADARVEALFAAAHPKPKP